MAYQICLDNRQWSRIFVGLHQILSIFYLVSIVQFCIADSSNENLSKYNTNNDVRISDLIADNSGLVDDVREPNKEDIRFRPTYAYSKVPFEIVYKMINDNQYGSDPLERLRKYDPSDRSFIRFGKSGQKSRLRKYKNYMKRPIGDDTSFIRFGKRSVNSQ